MLDLFYQILLQLYEPNLTWFQILSVWQTSESGLTLQLVDQEHLTWNQKNM